MADMTFVSETPTDRTEAINRAVIAEYTELLRQGHSQDAALMKACRTVVAHLDAKTRAELKLRLQAEAA